MNEPAMKERAMTETMGELREQAVNLRLHGLLAHWPEVMGQPEQPHRGRSSHLRQAASLSGVTSRSMRLRDSRSATSRSYCA